MNKIAVYGAGQMGLATIDLIKNKNLDIIAILDKNAKKLPREIEGIPVLSVEEFEATLYKNLIIVVCTAVCHFQVIEKELKDRGLQNIVSCAKYVHELYADKELINLWRLECGQENIIKKNQSLFSDEDSKEYYCYGAFFFTNLEDHDRLKIYRSKEKYFPPEIKKVLRDDEVILDTFWLNGEYINKYKELVGDFYHYYAFASPNIEVQKEESAELTLRSLEFSSFKSKRKELRIGIMRPYTETKVEEVTFDLIDNQMIDKRYTFLRCYSMSPCLDIIIGGIETIKRNRPIIAVNIGHYKQDFLEIPLLLKENLKNYYLIYRQHGYYGCDSIFYAIPKERFQEMKIKL